MQKTLSMSEFFRFLSAYLDSGLNNSRREFAKKIGKIFGLIRYILRRLTEIENMFWSHTTCIVTEIDGSVLILKLTLNLSLLFPTILPLCLCFYLCLSI